MVTKLDLRSLQTFDTCMMYFFWTLAIGLTIHLLLEWWLGPLDQLFVSLWNHAKRRHRIRSQVVALLKKRELDEWEKYKEERSEVFDEWWFQLPPFVCDWCHPKRKDFSQGYALAVAVMDLDFDAKFIHQEEEEP